MRIYVSGSLAFDRIMSFPGKFSDHILPEKVHILNVCFNINGLVEKYGGTAGNISYSLGLLDERPRLVATSGKDSDEYLNWLKSHGVVLDHVEVIQDTLTASAYITTDRKDNQITAFSPGAMDTPTTFNLEGVSRDEAVMIIAAGNKDDMARLSRSSRERGVPFIFDPGQSLNIWEGAELKDALTGATVFISNDYELALTLKSTGLSLAGLLERVRAIVTTKGEEGSIITTPEGERAVPPARARRVEDPTGAGDAYRAGFIKGMVLGLDLYTCGLMAGVCGSYAVENQGTQAHSFTFQEFAEKLAKEFGVTI